MTKSDDYVMYMQQNKTRGTGKKESASSTNVREASGGTDQLTTEGVRSKTSEIRGGESVHDFKKIKGSSIPRKGL